MTSDTSEETQTSKTVPEHVRAKLDSSGLEIGRNDKVVWSSESPNHPRNWSLQRKLYDTGVLATFMLISGLVGNIGTTVASHAGSELGISSIVANVIFSSIFFFGQAIGGLLLPPYTESFGRRPTNLCATAGFVAACIIVGAPRSVPAIVIGRFFSGVLSAVPAVIGSGAIEDMWDVRARVWAIDVWVKASIVGIAAGPCMATYISTSSLAWPWVFYLSAIFSAVAFMLYLGTKESRPSTILRHSLTAVRKSTGFDGLEYDSTDKVPNLRIFAETMLVRPVVFFFTEPIVTATEGLTVPYGEFGYSERQTSLVYFAWVIGLTLTIPLRIMDWRILSMRVRQNLPIRPEDKILGFYVAAPTLAGALWWFSWTIPPKVPNVSPFLSMAPLVLVGACTNEFDSILQGYLADSYANYAASANAPLAFLRGILSGAFPIFAKLMFEGLGSNVAGSILAGIATLFCFAAVWIWKYGARTRQRSKWAVGSEDEDKDEEGDEKEKEREKGDVGS